MKAYVKGQKNNAKSSITFCNNIGNVSIEDYKVMVSFNITFFYTTIPIIDKLNLVKDYVNNDDNFIKTAIPQDKLFDLLNLV